MVALENLQEGKDYLAYHAPSPNSMGLLTTHLPSHDNFFSLSCYGDEDKETDMALGPVAENALIHPKEKKSKERGRGVGKHRVRGPEE